MNNAYVSMVNFIYCFREPRCLTTSSGRFDVLRSNETNIYQLVNSIVHSSMRTFDELNFSDGVLLIDSFASTKLDAFPLTPPMLQISIFPDNSIFNIQ